MRGSAIRLIAVSWTFALYLNRWLGPCPIVTQALPPTDTATELADPFEIVSVAAATAPSGTSGGNWVRYEIRQGPNRIVGFRAGNKDRVTEHVRLMVLRLNERRRHRRGRVHVVLGRTRTEGKFQ